MDATRRKEIEAEIAAGIDTAANVATVIVPQYAGFIVLGQAVAKALPDLYEDVMRLIEKTEPSEADQADLAAKLAALAHPETI